MKKADRFGKISININMSIIHSVSQLLDSTIEPSLLPLRRTCTAVLRRRWPWVLLNTCRLMCVCVGQRNAVIWAPRAALLDHIHIQPWVSAVSPISPTHAWTMFNN